MTAGEMLFLETKLQSCIISSASYMASKEHKQTTKLLFLNLLFSSLTPRSTNQAPKAIVSTHRKHSRTAFNRPCTERQSAQRVVLACRPECENASKQARKSKSGVAETSHVPSTSVHFFVFAFFIIWCFFVKGPPRPYFDPTFFLSYILRIYFFYLFGKKNVFPAAAILFPI